MATEAELEVTGMVGISLHVARNESSGVSLVGGIDLTNAKYL